MKTGAQLYLDHFRGKFEAGEMTEEGLNKMVAEGMLEEAEKRYIMTGKKEALEN